MTWIRSGQVAQVVERSPEKAGVGGSTPSLATIFFKDLRIPYLNSLRTIKNKTERKISYYTRFVNRPTTRRCDSGTNCWEMSSVVLAREGRICPCASFTSAPAIFSQTACEMRSDRQFTHSKPMGREAGLMKRVSILLSRIGLPSLTDWKTKSSGRGFHNLVLRTVAFPA